MSNNVKLVNLGAYLVEYLFDVYTDPKLENAGTMSFQ